LPTVQAHSAKAELLSARCFATPASKRNVPERRAKPNCFLLRALQSARASSAAFALSAELRLARRCRAFE